jgi:hypothetical protein
MLTYAIGGIENGGFFTNDAISVGFFVSCVNNLCNLSAGGNVVSLPQADSRLMFQPPKM